MKTLVLLVVNLLVTTILAGNNVHPKLKVRDIYSRNSNEGTDGDQKEIEEHLRNTQKHLSEGSFNLKEIKSNDNLEVKNSQKRYKIKITSRALQRNDLPITEHSKTKKYKVVIKRKGVDQKNISAVDFDNIIKQIKYGNVLTRRDNDASKNYSGVFKQKNGSTEDLENFSQEEDGKENLLLDTAEISTFKIVNETHLDQNNSSTVDSGHLLSQFMDRNDGPLSENSEKKEYKLLLKLKSNDEEIKSDVDSASGRQPEHKRLKTYWKPRYYNQDSQSYYVNESSETGYTNIMLPNQHGSLQYIPFKHPNLLLRPRQDNKIRYIYQQDGKELVPYKWTETENPTDRLLLKLDSDSEVFNHHYVIRPRNTAYNVPIEHRIEYIENPNRKPIDWKDKQIFNSRPNVPMDYEYSNERSDYYNIYKGLDRDTSYNPSQRPDLTNKGYSYEVVVPFDSQNTVNSRYKNQNEKNKQRHAHSQDYDNYNPYSIEISKDRNKNIRLLRADLLQDYKNVNFHYENEIPIVSTDFDIKEPVYLDKSTAITQPQTINNLPDTNFDTIKVISEEIDHNDQETKENTAITQPKTINHGPEASIDSLKVISKDFDYNYKETKDSSNETMLNVIPIHEVKNENQIEDEHPIIDTRYLNNKGNGKFPSDVDFYEAQTPSNVKPDVTKIQILPIDDVLDLCMKLNVDVLVRKFNLNQPKYVADLEKFLKLLEQFVKEQPYSPLRGVVFKLLIKVYLVLQHIENPSKSFDTNDVESIGSFIEQKVKAVDNQNTDILEVIKQAVKDLEKPVSTESIKPQYEKYSPEPKLQDPHISYLIFENPVLKTEDTVNPTLDTILFAPQNLQESGEINLQKEDLLLEKEDLDVDQNYNLNLDNQPFGLSENEPHYKVEQPLIDGVNKEYEAFSNTKSPEKIKFSEEREQYSDNDKFPITKNVTETENEGPQQVRFETSKQSLFTENNDSDISEPVQNQNKLPQNPIVDIISSDISEKSQIEIFANPKQIYNIKEQNPVISDIKILEDLDRNIVPTKNIVTIEQENDLSEPDYTDKRVQIEVDEQHPFNHKYFEELLDTETDNLNPESVKKYNFDKETIIRSIPIHKFEETFGDNPDKDLVPAKNDDVAIKPEHGLYKPEQESGNGIIPESENIDGPNHQSVSIPKKPKFDEDKVHTAYNEHFELILDPEIVTNFEDSANKPVTDRIHIPEINVLNPELVKKSKESGSSGIYIQPMRVENNEDLIPPIDETVKIEPETRQLPEQVQLEEDKQDPVYYEYLEEYVDPKKDNLPPESIKNYKDADIKPVTSENSEETFDLNPNESNTTWNQIDTKPISEYVIERHFYIPKQVKLDEDVNYPGNNDYYEIPRTNINKAPVTNETSPVNSKEVTFTNTKDPVLALLRELESNKDSNEDLIPSDKNVNSIDYDLSLKIILELIENLCARLRKYHVPGHLIKKIIKKVLIITIRKLEENDLKCSERVKFDRFVNLLKRDVGNIDFSSKNDTVNVSKDELKRILRFEEMVQLLRQLFEPRILLVTRVYY